MKTSHVEADENRMSLRLGPCADVVSNTLRRLDADHVVPRIWNRDHTVWKPDPDDIADRLGWLGLPSAMRGEMPSISAFADEVRRSGYRHVVLLGMGGSSLAAEVLRQACAPNDHPLKLIVLDSTIPASIREVAATIDPARTLFIVSSKSGTTIEPNVLYSYFRDAVDRRAGRERAGANFVAVTDSGAPLERMAREHGFRRVFNAQEDLGGRYSALSHFGLLPAALAGVDSRSLLDRAETMAERCTTTDSPRQNPAALLGASMAALAEKGLDKLTLVTSPSVAAFGMWVDQLIAESVGKDGLGIVPVVGEPLMPPRCYGDDRLFVYLRNGSDPNEELDESMAALKNHGRPVIVIHLRDAYDLGGEFFRWEFATAVAASILGVHPFDQPDVQASKEQTFDVLREIESSGVLPDAGPTGSIDDLLRHARPGDYLAIMAYVHPTPETDRALAGLRRAVMERHKIATTLGYGPRLLHSTGQLHKHGPNTGLFLQIVSDDDPDTPIPGKAYSFGALAKAQAMGDYRALTQLRRPIVRIDPGSPLLPS